MDGRSYVQESAQIASSVAADSNSAKNSVGYVRSWLAPRAVEGVAAVDGLRKETGTVSSFR